jgi:hypothetical protein
MPLPDASPSPAILPSESGSILCPAEAPQTAAAPLPAAPSGGVPPG